MSFLYRLILVYLCVYMVFPPQVWAAATEHVQDEAPAPAVRVPPLETKPKSDRDRLRVQLHEAAWKMAVVLKMQAPALGKIHSASHYTLLRPYEHCASPLKTLPQSAVEIDEQILKPAQDALIAFLKSHASEIGDLSHRNAKLPGGAPRLDLLSSKETDAVCLPAVWQPELYDSEDENEKGPEALAEQLEKLKSDGMKLQTAFFVSLSRRKADAPLTDREMRQWLGWMAGLRMFRAKMAKFYKAKNGVVANPVLPMVVDFSTGKAVTQNDAAIIAKRGNALAIANDMMNSTTLLESLPRFVPCAELGKISGHAASPNDIQSRRYCFFDGKEPTELTEELFLSVQKVHDADEKVAHGALLEAEKKLAVQGLLMELATVSTLTPQGETGDRAAFEKQWIPEACIQSSEIEPYRDSFYDLARVEEQAWWIQRLNEVTAHIEEDYRTGKVSAPVPQSEEFYHQAQEIAVLWISRYESLKNEAQPAAQNPPEEPGLAPKKQTEEPVKGSAVEANTTEGASAPEATASQPSQTATPSLQSDGLPADPKPETPVAPKPPKYSELLQMFPFESRIRDLNRGELQGVGRDFDTRLGQKLHMWSILVSEELANLPKDQWKEQRDAILKEMLRQVVSITLTEALEIYVESFFMEQSQSTQVVNSIWEEEFRAQWQKVLDSPKGNPIAEDLEKMVDALHAQILSHESFDGKFDPNAAADKALGKYVDSITENVKEAEKARDAMEFMLSHVFDQKFIPNLVPGGAWNPSNYHYRNAQVEDVTHAPAAFQLADEAGHGWYPMFALDASQADDYIHVKRGLRAMVIRHRDALIDRLTKWALRHRCYRDEELARTILDLRGVKLEEGESLTRRASDEAMLLEDAQLTPALRTQANEEVRMRYENVRTVSNLADLVIDKFFETMEADGDLDRGRVTRERQERYRALQEWLKKGDAPIRYDERRIAFGKKLYENYFEPVLDSLNEGNRTAIVAHLNEIAKLLFEREIFFVTPSAELDALQAQFLEVKEGASEHDKKLAEKEALYKAAAKLAVDQLLRRHAIFKSRIDSNGLLSTLASIRQEATQQNYFSRKNSTWPGFCKENPAECREWFKRVSAFLRDERIRFFFEKRLELRMGDFVKLFGENQELYAGQTYPENDPRFHQLKFMKDRFFDGWYGVSLQSDPADFQSQAADIREAQEHLLKSISDKAHRAGNETTLALLPEVLKNYEEKYNLYDNWRERLEHRLQIIEQAVNSNDETQLAAALIQVRAVFLKEIDVFKDANFEFSPTRFREYLISDVGIIFLPEYPLFWRELSQRFEQYFLPQKNPIKEIAECTNRLVELKDALWKMDFREEKGSSSKDEEEAKNIEREMAYQETLIERARERLNSEFVLTRAIQNYLSGVTEAKAAVEIGAGDGSADLWSRYFADQFENTHEDGLGKPMALSPGEIVSDLNKVASQVKGRLIFTPEIAKEFVEDTRDYCEIGKAEPHRSAFERNYAAVLAQQLRIVHEAREGIRAIEAEKQEIEFRRNAKMDAPADWVARAVEPTLIDSVPDLWEDFLKPEKEKEWSAKESTYQTTVESVKKRLKRFWSYALPLELLSEPQASEAAFEAWFNGAVSKYDPKATDHRPLLDGFPSVDRFCEKISEEAAGILAAIESHEKAAKEAASAEAPPVPEALETKYWQFVQGSSDVFHQMGVSFGPLWKTDGSLVWFRHAPAAHFGAQGLFGLFTEEAPLTAEKIVLTLRELLRIEQLGEPEFSRIWEPEYLGALQIAKPETFDQMGKLAWLGGLSTENQRFVYNRAQAFFRNALRGKNATTLLNLVGGKAEDVTRELGYGEWYATMRKHMLLWESLESEFDLNALASAPSETGTSNDKPTADEATGPVTDPTRSAVANALPKDLFFTLARRITELFMAHTPYRYVGGRLEIPATPVELSASMDQMDQLARKDERRKLHRLVKDVVSRFDEELGHAENDYLQSGADLDVIPPRELQEPREFDAFAHVWRKATSHVPNAESRALEYYCEHFVIDNQVQKSSGLPPIWSWREHHGTRSLLGELSYLTDSHQFRLSWLMTGSLGRQSSSFLEWFDFLARDARAPEKFAELKKQPSEGEGQVHLWERFASLEDFRNSTLFTQFEGILRIADGNSAAKQNPETYPYFLALLHWNMKDYGAHTIVGPVADDLPFGDIFRAGLLKELVAVLGLDMKRFSGWEDLLKRRGTPEEWYAIAMSKKNYLVGMNERRFLSTSVPAHQVTGAGAGFGHYQRPLYVSALERTQFLPVENPEEAEAFAKWVASTEDAQTTALLRANLTSEENQPLYQRIVSVETQMLGEMDIQAPARGERDLGVEGNPTQHSRFSDRWGKWGTFKFGEERQLGREESERISRQVGKQGHATPSVDQVQAASRIREAYVDFRNTVSELNYRYGFEEKSKLNAPRMDVRFTSLSSVHSETEKALHAYLIQMGVAENRAKELSEMEFPRGDFSEEDGAAYRRRLATQAIYIASWATHQKLFDGRNESERDQIKASLGLIDTHYRREAKKIEVRRGLAVVKKNVQDQLGKLCAVDFSGLRTDEDFEKAEPLLKETRMIYFNNLHDFLYLESGWVEKGSESETRRRLIELVDRQHEGEKWRHRVGFAVTILVGISILAMILGSRNPGMAAFGRSVIARNALLRNGLLAMTLFMGGYFLVDVGIDSYEDIWGNPAEKELLTSIRDSQFAGYRSLMKDSTAAKLEEDTLSGVVNARTAMPTLKWLWRIWLVAVSFQMMGPALKASIGGATQALRYRMLGARGYYLYELRRRAAAVGIDAAEVVNMRASALKRLVEKREAEVIIEHLGALEAEDGTLLLRGRGLRALKRQADREWENLCKELQLSPETGKPLEMYGGGGTETGPNNWASRVWNSLFGNMEESGNLYIAAQRRNALERIQFLQNVRAKLASRHPHLTMDDLTQLMAGQDVHSLHTPMIYTLLGIPYTSETLRVLDRVGKVVERGQLARRLIAIQSLLRWRNSSEGFGAFEEAAREINAESGKVVCTADDLLWALYHPNARYHQLVVYGRPAAEGVGGVGDSALATALRNHSFRDLQRSAQEFADILYLGSWTNNREFFRMIARGHSIEGDQVLIRYLLEQEQSLLLRGTADPRIGVRRPQGPEEGYGNWDSESGPQGDPFVEPDRFEGAGSLWSPGDDSNIALLDGPEPAAQTATATKPRLDFRPVSEDVIIPTNINTADGILDYYATLPPDKLARIGLHKGNRDIQKEIRDRMYRDLSANDFDEIHHLRLLKSGLSAEDLQSVMKKLIERDLMTPSLLRAYRQAIAHIRAYEMMQGAYANTNYYKALVDWYLMCFETGGDQMSVRLAEELFQFLYGKEFFLLTEEDAFVKFGKLSRLVGDWRSGSEPTSINIIDRRSGRIEALLEKMAMEQPELASLHEQALARFRAAREQFETYIVRESHDSILTNLSAVSSRDAVWGPGEFNEFMAQAFPKEGAPRFGADLNVEAREFAQELFLTQLSSGRLWTAMEAADAKGFLSESEREVYRRVIAYLRAREVLGGDWSEGAGKGVYHFYLKLFGGDFKGTLSQASRTYAEFFGANGAEVRDFKTLFEALGLRPGASRAQIRARIDWFSRTLRGIESEQGAEFKVLAERALSRIDRAENLLTQLWGWKTGETGWKDALYRLVPKDAAVESASRAILDELFGSFETVPDFFSRLHVYRIRAVRALARQNLLNVGPNRVEADQVGKLLEFLDSLRALSQSHVMLNFARANGIIESAEAERLAEVFFRTLKGGRVRFALNRAEAEEVIAQYAARFNSKTTVEELRGMAGKRDNLEKLMEHLKDPKVHGSLPEPLYSRLVEAANRLWVEGAEPLLESSLLARSPYGLPWEILGHEEVSANRQLGRFLFDTEEGLFESALRTVTAENPEAAELNRFLDWIETSQQKFASNLEREMRTARWNQDWNKIQELMGQSQNGPRQQVLRELRARKAWAEQVGDGRQQTQMERAIERIEKGTHPEETDLSAEGPLGPGSNFGSGPGSEPSVQASP